MKIQGKFNFMPVGGNAAQMYPDAVGVLSTQPEIFVPGIFISVVTFYSDADMGEKLIQFNITTTDGAEEAALLQAKNEFAPEMDIMD